jgi:hypothetical protein
VYQVAWYGAKKWQIAYALGALIACTATGKIATEVHLPKQTRRKQPNQKFIEEKAKEIQSIFDEIGAALEHDAQAPSNQRFNADDPREGARLTVKSACVAAEQRYRRSGDNPRHVWEAIRMCTHPDVAPMMLPSWCTAYLHQVANGLLDAAGDGEKLTAFIARELGFIKPGWSAIKDSAARSRATAAASLFEQLCWEGKTAAEAYESVREKEGYAEVVSARNLVKKGKAMLAYVPLPDEADD